MPSLVAPAIPVGTLAGAEQPVLRAGAGVILRPWMISDAAAVMEAFQDPAIQRWHVRRADSVDEARGWIEEWQGTWRQEKHIHWAVAAGDAHADAGTLLGRLSLKSLNLADGEAELAYWVTPRARGRGICPRAVDAAATWALGTAGFHRLELEHSTANPASCRVAVKAGFGAEGVRRGAALHIDGWHDMHLHARLRGT